MVALNRILALLILFVFVSPIYAQRPKKGDEVEVFYLQKWYPGTVLQTNDKGALVSYVFISERQQVFPFNQIRFAWQANAITPMRTWTDKTGKYKVVGAAVKVDQGKVTLHCKDNSEVEIEIVKLSDVDQRILDKAEVVAGPPPIDSSEILSFLPPSADLGWAHEWNSAEGLGAIPPDVPSGIVALPMSGVGFAKQYSGETLGRLIPIGGSDGWLVAGVHDYWQKQPGRVVWASLAKKKVTQIQLLPPGHRMVGAHPASRQIVSLKLENRKPELTVWQGDPTVKKLERKKSWASLNESGWASWDNYIEMINERLVLHEWGSKRYVCWDVEQEAAAYTIDQESFFGAKPVFSANHRYMVLPEDKRVRVIDAVTGKVLASLPIKESCAGVGISADGQRIAALTYNKILIWQFGSNLPPTEYKSNTVGEPFTANIEFVDDDLMMIDGRMGGKSLIDLKLEAPIWSYRAKTFEVSADSRGNRTTSVFDGKLVYYASVSNAGVSGFVVGAVSLPGPMVREATKDVTVGDLYSIVAGHHVKIVTKCGSYDSSVRAALAAKIKEIGWVLDEAATTVVEAAMGQKPSESVTYRDIRTNKETTVTSSPFFSTLSVVQNGEVAWTSSSYSGSPGFVYAQSMSEIQSKVSELQKPDPEFFARVEIPQKLFNPKLRYGFGLSVIGLQGIVPQKSDPTGMIKTMEPPKKDVEPELPVK